MVDKKNWEKAMKNLLFHLKLVRGVREVVLAYVVLCHVKVAHTSHGYLAYLKN